MNRKGGKAGNPGREGTISGVTKIRGYNNRRGHPAAVITLPSEVMKEFGWQPGMYLTFYPTKARELVLVRQDQAMVHLSPDYDLSLTKMGEPMPGPRPGSMAEREIAVSAEMEGLATRLSQGKRLGLPTLQEMDAKIDEMGLSPEELMEQKASSLTVDEWLVVKKEKKRRLAKKSSGRGR